MPLWRFAPPLDQLNLSVSTLRPPRLAAPPQDYTHKIKIKGPGKNFERGTKDTFRSSTINIGNLKHVVVRKDEAGFSSDWHLKAVEIFHLAMGKRYVLYCKEWLKGAAERKLEVSKVEDVTDATTPGSPSSLSPR